MGADGDVHLAFRQVRQRRFEFLGCAKPAEHLGAHGEWLETPLEGLEVLKCEDCSRSQDRHLLAVAQRLEGGAHHHFGLAEAHIPAQQAVHGLKAFHVALDLPGGGDLVARLGEFEGIFEFALPVAIRGKPKALRHLAGGVELEQLVRHVAHFGFDPRLGARPGDASHAVKRRLGVAPATPPLDQVHAGQGHVELGAAGIFEEHVVALGLALGDLAQAQVLSHSMLGVHHVIARLQIDQVGGKSGQRGLGNRGSRHQLGGLEQILSAKYYKVRIWESSATADQPLDHVNAGHGTGQVSALGQVGGRGVELHQAELVKDAVFVEDVRHSFYFTCRRSEERHAIARLNQRAGLGDGHLHVAMKGQGRPGGDVRIHVGGPSDVEFPEGHLRTAAGLPFQVLPAEVNPIGVVGRRAFNLFEAFPEPFGGSAHLLGFIPKHDGALKQREDRGVARPEHGGHQFPAGKRLAWRRQVAARDAGLAHQSTQFHQQGTRLLPFGQREQGAIFDLEDGALRLHVEAAYGFHLVAKQVETDGVRRLGRKHVQNPAADGVFPDHFNRLAPLVADAIQVRDHFLERQLVAHP